MNQDRAKAAEAALKNVETLKKSLTKSNSAKAKTLATPEGPTKIQASGLPTPVAGTGFVQYIMYSIGGILLLGVVLMVVDRWFFPIFKRTPGGPGYISLPGTDMSDNYWTDLTSIRNITVGSPPPTATSSTSAANPAPLYSSSLASQPTYSITLDVMINDEKPQDLGATTTIMRTFFFLGSGLEDTNRKITFTMDNSINRVHVNVFNIADAIQSCVIDNVPIHVPFRIGLVKTSYAMEAYLNGLLVHTVQLKGQQLNPDVGDIIYAPQNITSPPSATKTTRINAVTTAETALTTAKNNADTAETAALTAARTAATTVSTENTAAAATAATANVAAQLLYSDAQTALATAQAALTTASAEDKILSKGIQVMNLNLFPYAVMPNEMQARMSDLTQVTTFNPTNTPSSTVNSVSSWWRFW
jgi:hypothetical protein